MNVKLIIICLFVLCLGLTNVAMAGQVELINNGSFANGLTGWDSWAGTRTLEGTVLDSNNFAPSAHCAKITGGYRHIEANNPCTATVTAGMVFHVSAWFYVPALDDGSGATSARVYMRYQTATGAILLVDDQVTDHTIPIGTWCHKTFDVTPSTPGDMLYLAFGVYGHIGDTRSATAPTTYFDELSVTVDGYNVSGTVALEDNTDATGVKVELLSGTTVVKTVTTAANGAYSFDVLAGSYTVSASKDGYRTSTAAVDATAADVIIPQMTLVKKPVNIVTGKVVDSNNVAVAGAEISIMQNDVTTATGVLSGADGMYSIQILDYTGDVQLWATKENYYDSSTSSVTIVEGTTSYTAGDLVMQRMSTYKISGIVTNSATGLPAPNVKLTIDAGPAWGPYYAYTTVSGADGSYSVDAKLGVPYAVDVDATQTPKVVMLTPLADRSQDPNGNGLMSDWTNVNVSVIIYGTISGKVVTTDATAPSGFNIIAVDAAGLITGTATTAADGTYTASIAPGESIVAARKLGYLTMPAPQAVTIVAGDYPLVDFTASPAAGNKITGVLKNADGNPIPNGVVQADGVKGPAIVTDATGAYSFTSVGGCGGVELYADAINYKGKQVIVTDGTAGQYKKDIVLVSQDESAIGYDGNMEDLVGFKPDQWIQSPWSAPNTVDWSASSVAKTGQQSLFYTPSETPEEYAGIVKVIQLVPGCSYNFYFTAKADPEVKRWQPLIEFMDAEGNNWDGFVSADPAHIEYSHIPPYEWLTYFNWMDRSGTKTGAPVRWTPLPLQTECHFIFLYEGDDANGTANRLPPPGKGCYIDDIVLDAVPANIPFEIVPSEAISTEKPVGVNNKSALTDDKLVGKTVKVWGKVVSIGATSFVISDGYSAGVTINTNTLPAADSVGKMAVVTGVINAQKSVDASAISLF